ncbi:MAG TPA: nicotinate (nicotinamide) nucleotide adenylyltransferase [Acidobacteriaceae bacterium]|jgi:nicotinate-nucleotide adenylyltransferase|nr:nicotinate (nicotinamide) nucleotide adenylyltransferase [Acidobacteriaceae bacterium]
MRIGFFGGTFDPPHLGHLAVARAAALAFHLDRVLLAPVAWQPLKPNSAEASFDDRLYMVQLLCEETPLLEASSVDGPREDLAPNYTIDTLQQLRSTLPQATSLFVIVGADSFRTLRQWRCPEELLRAADWIVVSRPYAAASSLESLHLTTAQQSHVHPLDSIAEPASATNVRARLRAGDDCPELLPASILAYIRAHHLYGT